MSLVSMTETQSENELSVMLRLLWANNIPAFVKDEGFSGALPGVQIKISEVRRIMVPNDSAGQARDILAAFAKLPEEHYPLVK